MASILLVPGEASHHAVGEVDISLGRRRIIDSYGLTCRAEIRPSILYHLEHYIGAR